MSRPKHSVETLVVTAAFSRSMTDLLLALGEEITPRKRAAMWARLGAIGADTTHWERSARGGYHSEDLARAVAASESVAGVLRILGIRPAGGSHFNISRRIQAAGLDTTHFTGQGHNRGRPGPKRAAAEILVRLPAGANRAKRSMLVRAMIESGVSYECAHCQLGPTWHGKPITLAVDHIDGDWLNNQLDNLRFLCPNCHAQTATWCRRKGS